MLVQEFIDRTNYYPTADEWNNINHSYMFDTPLDKDAFCKQWKKANKNIIAEQVKNRKENAERKHAEGEHYNEYFPTIGNVTVFRHSKKSI